MVTYSILPFARSLLCTLPLLATYGCAPISGSGPTPSKPTPVELRPNASAAGAPKGPRTKAEQRAACEFTAGMLPADTLDTGSPIGEKIPIDHFVVVMQENRSFDHYFQKLPDYGQSDVDVAPPAYLNLDASREGEAVRPYRLDDLCVEDPPHGWIDVRNQISDGKMDGFVRVANPDGRRVVGYYDSRQLPFYYALATSFAISDRYFAAMPGPTFPNRMFFLSASSFGHAENTPPPPQAEERTLFHQLEKKGLSWVVYSQGRTFEEQIFPRLHAEKGEHFRPMSEFFDDAKAGKLPFLAWVESSYGVLDATDEHPPANVQLGQEFVAKVVYALVPSPVWPRSALVLTYDEHGGFFDHVPPPAACPPDEEPPRIRGVDPSARFSTLGVRVPFIIVSPFARAHYVSHHTYSHTSILRLIQARAELPALTRRDANDVAPFDLFDFDHPPFLTPPRLTKAEIDNKELKRCLKKYRAKTVGKSSHRQVKE